MKNQALVDKAKAIIEQVKYITIASVTPAGEPWNSPVFAAFDHHYNFYWNSWKENQHSVNIQNHPQVFLVIYNSMLPEGSGAHIGVYIQAQVRMLDSAAEIESALKLLQKRKQKPSSKLRSTAEFMGEYPRRVFQAIPQRMWLNGMGEVNGNYIDTREELSLDDLII